MVSNVFTYVYFAHFMHQTLVYLWTLNALVLLTERLSIIKHVNKSCMNIPQFHLLMTSYLARINLVWPVTQQRCYVHFIQRTVVDIIWDNLNSLMSFNENIL